MPNSIPYPVLDPDLQVNFLSRLRSAEESFLHLALKKAVEQLLISELDQSLFKVAGEDGLKLTARHSIRGEVVFATPEILITNPHLIAYYRLLLGFSQKEFYSKGPFGTFRTMEESGKLGNQQREKLPLLCASLADSSKRLLKRIDQISAADVYSLQLMTLGSQFRGSRNNEIGHKATERVFSIIKSIVKKYITEEGPNEIKIRNNSGRIVKIRFAADPDIEIEEQLESGTRGLISIEIKGGEDVSNIHNRIGEAEKSHQKAKRRGYFEFMTIVNVSVDHKVLRQESPTTSHFFDLSTIENKKDVEFKKFVELIASIISIRL